jgi:hypothetical protein
VRTWNHQSQLESSFGCLHLFSRGCASAPSFAVLSAHSWQRLSFECAPGFPHGLPCPWRIFLHLHLAIVFAPGADEVPDQTERDASGRPVVLCANCGLEKGHAAHGLCFMCFQRSRRASERSRVDKHCPAINCDMKKLVTGYAKLVSALGDLGTSPPLTNLILRLVQPHVASV